MVKFTSSRPSTTSLQPLCLLNNIFVTVHICILVIDLIYWRCLKRTGIVVATGLVLLFSLTTYTFLSVVTFFSMALLTVSLLYRVGMTVMGAIQKTGTDNPFK